DAVAKRTKHPKASFVTPGGVLLGPASIRTAASSDVRGKEIRDELAVVEHDLAVAASSLRPKRATLEEILGRSEALRAQLPSAEVETALPSLPPLPEPPVRARVEAEALHRNRASLEARRERL